MRVYIWDHLRCSACLYGCCYDPLTSPHCSIIHYHYCHVKQHPLTLWASQPGTVILDDDHTANGRSKDVEIDVEIDISNRLTRLEVSFAPGAFLLQNVLSKAECAQLIAASEALGYTADEPAGGSVSVLVSSALHIHQFYH
jgi:hypothetical protein